MLADPLQAQRLGVLDEHAEHAAPARLLEMWTVTPARVTPIALRTAAAAATCSLSTTSGIVREALARMSIAG